MRGAPPALLVEVRNSEATWKPEQCCHPPGKVGITPASKLVRSADSEQGTCWPQHHRDSDQETAVGVGKATLWSNGPARRGKGGSCCCLEDVQGLRTARPERRRNFVWELARRSKVPGPAGGAERRSPQSVRCHGEPKQATFFIRRKALSGSEASSNN